MMREMPQGHEEFACATFRMRMCNPQPIRLASLLKGEENAVPKGRQPRRLASLASPHHPRAAGGRKILSTFHCRGAERSRQVGCARGRLGLLGSAVASVLTIARSNGVGIEAAMRARMGSPKNVTAIVIITTDTRTTSTSVMIRLEKCFVMI